MDKKGLVDLTNIIYKITLLFPKKEPLRYKMRETADDVLAKHLTRKDLVKDLEVMEGFLEVAKAQNWVQKDQVLEIQKEYGKLRQGLETKRGENPNSQNKVRQGLPERQERIMLFLREQGRAQVWQIKEILQEVTKRTLRRDFDALLKQGLIERVGERNNTFYQIKTA